MIGQIKKINDHYNVTYELASNLNGGVLSARNFVNLELPQLRLLAHIVSNFIYESITENKG